MTSWTCTVPLPSRDLSPNGSRGHWSRTARARRDYRELCEAILRPAAPHQPFERCFIKATLLICRSPLLSKGVPRPGVPLTALDSYRPADLDNAIASCKPILDACQSAGVIRSDAAKYVASLEVGFERVLLHSLEGVRLEITTAD